MTADVEAVIARTVSYRDKSVCSVALNGSLSSSTLVGAARGAFICASVGEKSGPKLASPQHLFARARENSFQCASEHSSTSQPMTLDAASSFKTSRSQSLTLQFAHVHVRLLLIAEQRVEEGVDQVAVRHGVRAAGEERVEEEGDVVLAPLRHLLDLLPAQAVQHAGLAQAAKEGKCSWMDVVVAMNHIDKPYSGVRNPYHRE